MEMGSNLLVNLKNEGLQKILQSFSRGHVFLYITFSFLQKKTALLRGGVGGGERSHYLSTGTNMTNGNYAEENESALPPNNKWPVPGFMVRQE